MIFCYVQCYYELALVLINSAVTYPAAYIFVWFPSLLIYQQATFLLLKKGKEAYEITLPSVCVSVYVSLCLSVCLCVPPNGAQETTLLFFVCPRNFC